MQDMGGVFVVQRALKFCSADLRGVLVVPGGFTTDLASIPQALQNLAPKVGKYDSAAVLHDAAYAGALKTEEGQRVHLIKPLADRLFLEAMLSLDVPSWRAHAMYFAVRLFGRMHEGTELHV